MSHFPLQMPPSRFQRALIDAYRAIYSPTQVLRALTQGRYTDARWKLLHRYLWRDIEPGIRAYLPYLEELEEGLYDSQGRLCEDLLVQRVQADGRWTVQAGNRTIQTLGLSPLELPLPGKRNITCLPPKLSPDRSSEVGDTVPSASG